MSVPLKDRRSLSIEEKENDAIGSDLFVLLTLQVVVFTSYLHKCTEKDGDGLVTGSLNSWKPGAYIGSRLPLG